MEAALSQTIGEDFSIFVRSNRERGNQTAVQIASKANEGNFVAVCAQQQPWLLMFRAEGHNPSERGLLICFEHNEVRSRFEVCKINAAMRFLPFPCCATVAAFVWPEPACTVLAKTIAYLILRE